MASPTRRAGRALAAAVISASVLGILPPAGGSEPAAVSVRVVPLEEARLAPPGIRLASTPGSISLARRAWSRTLTSCAPSTFTMAGLIWRQRGVEEIPVRLSWGDGAGDRVRVVADPAEAPDRGAPDDRGWDGTPPVWTGGARCLQLSLRLPARTTLADLRAVYIDTAAPAGRSFLEAAGDLLAAAWGMVAEPFRPASAEAITVQPPIITRAEWGADESLRRCGPDYAPALKMAYVHHTVNSNGYAAEEADDIIRGIYAYHVKGRKYCDIAYNFLIDRFGRIYEGRFGGIDQPVIGGHAQGFNTASTGIAAIGTFTRTDPPRKVISAYRRLLAWRLDVAHLRPTGTTVMTSGGGSSQKYDRGEEVSLPVIAGHRDTGLTSCPGARLYAKLQNIRVGAERRGLPKIWDPAAVPNPAPAGTTQIQLSAALSQEMDWTVQIASSTAPTTPFRRFAGRGPGILVSWDRTGDDPLAPPAPPGTYLVTFRAAEAGVVARDATITLTLG